MAVGITGLKSLASRRLIRVLAIGLVLASGMIMRLWLPGDFEFKRDEALALAVGGDWLDRPGIATHGLRTSLGLRNPPFSIYLFALIHALSGGDPTLGGLAVIVANIGGLILALIWLGRESAPLGRFWAFWALGLLCLNPWLVINSRKIWAQNLLFPLMMVAVWGLSSIWSREGKWPRVVAGLVSLVAATQVHLSGVFMGVGFALGMLVFWPRERRRLLPIVFAIGAGLSLLFSLPWLPHLFRFLAENPLHSQRLTAGAPLVHVLPMFFGIWSGEGIFSLGYYFGPGEFRRFGTEMGGIWAVVQVLAILILIGGWIFGMAEVLHETRRRAWSSMVAPLCFGLVGFFVALLVSGIRPLPHYALVAALPATVFLAQGFSALDARLASARARILARAAGLLVLTACVWTSVGFMTYIHVHRGTGGDYGLVLHEKVRNARRLLESKGGGPVSFETYYLVRWLAGKKTQPPPEFY